jgi:hypothetical protein
MKGQAAFLSCDGGGEESALFGYLSMSNLLEHETTHSPVSLHDQVPSTSYRLLRFIIWGIIVLALLSGVVLLLSDVVSTPFSHTPVSASPLLLIGVAYLIFQLLTRPKPLDLFKACIVSLAFILWGVDQLLPSGWFATLLGDIVITLYVIDLGWMMLERLRH